MGAPITIKRSHGLGNVLLLLPVLDHLQENGQPVRLLTRPDWVDAIGALATTIDVVPFDGREGDGFVDLDAMTATIKPVAHRTNELARLLGVEDPVAPRTYSAPKAWASSFEHLSGAVVLAPEAMHPARQWPWSNVQALSLSLLGKPLVVTGVDQTLDISADMDLRGVLELKELLGIISQASAVIALDSGTLHMATALGIPGVAIFGGVNPAFRIRPEQRMIALQGDLACAPCNKNETCDGRYPCLEAVHPRHVLSALDDLGSCKGMEIRRVCGGEP